MHKKQTGVIRTPRGDGIILGQRTKNVIYGLYVPALKGMCAFPDGNVHVTIDAGGEHFVRSFILQCAVVQAYYEKETRGGCQTSGFVI